MTEPWPNDATTAASIDAKAPIIRSDVTDMRSTDGLLSTLVDAESAFTARDRQGLRQHARKLGARSSALNGVLQLLPAALNVPDTSVDRASLLIQPQLGLADH